MYCPPRPSLLYFAHTLTLFRSFSLYLIHTHTFTPLCPMESCVPKRNWILQNGRVLQKFLFHETTIKVLTPSALCRITLIRASF